MNKYLIKFLLLSLFVSIQCKSTQDKIDIIQKKTEDNIIIRTASDDENSITTIQFPNKVILSNKSSVDIHFLTIKYKYNENIPQERKSGFGLNLYKKKKNNLTRKKNNKKTAIRSESSLEYVYLTRHFVDSTKYTQQHFKPFIEKMLEENKDTLHIGTVSEFKRKHKELFERLTKNDSLSIQFLDEKKLGEKITVPAKW